MANEGPSRIREIPPEQLSAPQKAAIEAVIGGRGRIPGPYKIWLHSPILMQRLERLGTFLVNESSLKPREQELAILCIAAHWHGNFVFTVHSRVAREQGVPESVIEDIRTGRMPKLTDQREGAVVEIALSVGFQTQAHFTTVFKRFTGETPHRWRSAQQMRVGDGSRPRLVGAGYRSAARPSCESTILL